MMADKTSATTNPATADESPVGLRPPGYRLPAATRLGCVRLQVADLARSLAYYQEVIGLRVLDRTAKSASLGPHGEDRVLVELLEHEGATPVPRRGRLGLYHFALLLPERADLGRFLRHLGERGVYAGMSDHSFSEAIYLTDPDGLGIEVYADRPRSLWRYQDREVVGDTLPLDVHSLLEAAGDVSWTGLPAGTVLGHVHLYVDDIEKAAAFYHAGLGFDAIIRSYPGALFVSAGGYHHHLGLNTWAAGAATAQPDDARLLEWEVVLPTPADAEAAARSLLERGYEVSQGGEMWLAADPWGTGLRLRS